MERKFKQGPILPAMLEDLENKNKELLEALKKAVKHEVDKYEADMKYASQHNNTDGVGIHFDYYSAKPMPEWVKPAQEIIEKATE